MVVVNLKRKNKGRKQKVLVSHFPKLKEASWFVIIANNTKNELLGLKRISFNRYASKSIAIKIPDFTDDVELHLICDSYIGLDQAYKIKFEQMNSLIK